MLKRVKKLEQKVNELELDIKGMSIRQGKQADIFSDMVTMFSVLLNKGVITNDEVIEQREKLQAQLDSTESSSEIGDVQPKETGTDESDSGSGE